MMTHAVTLGRPWPEIPYTQPTCSGKTVMCLPGTLVHVPAGTVHGFHFGVGGGEMLEFTGQGGSATQMFTAVNKEIPPGPPDIPKVLKVLKQR